MKRLVITLLTVLFVLIPVSAANPWNIVAEKYTPSVVFIEAVDANGEPTGYCSGFVISVTKKYVATAAHCDAERLLVNGTQSYRMYKDARKDLMVLRASELEGLTAAFTLAPHDPKVGEEVASIGFGFALEKAMFRISHISIANLDVEGLSGPFFMTDAGFMPGQSGGPVVNDKGEIVAIVQRGNQGLGLGVGADVIKDRIGRYFGE